MSNGSSSPIDTNATKRPSLLSDPPVAATLDSEAGQSPAAARPDALSPTAEPVWPTRPTRQTGRARTVEPPITFFLEIRHLDGSSTCAPVALRRRPPTELACDLSSSTDRPRRLEPFRTAGHDAAHPARRGRSEIDSVELFQDVLDFMREISGLDAAGA